MTYISVHKKPGRSRVRDRGETSLKQGIAGQTVLLQDFAQALERLDLNLPDPLTRQADFLPDFFQRTALMAAQTKAAHHHLTLFVGEIR